jgi:hypothetical protein
LAACSVAVYPSDRKPSPQEAQLAEKIKAELLKGMTVELEPVEDPSISTCFAAKFYQAVPTLKVGDSGSASFGSYLYAVYGATVAQVERPGGDRQDLPGLLKAINPRFRLKSDADGKALLAALDALFGKGTVRIGKFDPSVKREGMTWTFITGTFFKKFKGYLVQTDPTGRITGMRYSLSIRSK